MSDIYTKDTDTRFTLRIDSELLDTIKEHAKRAKRSTAKQIEFILEQWCSQENAKAQEQ